MSVSWGLEDIYDVRNSSDPFYDRFALEFGDIQERLAASAARFWEERPSRRDSIFQSEPTIAVKAEDNPRSVPPAAPPAAPATDPDSDPQDLKQNKLTQATRKVMRAIQDGRDITIPDVRAIGDLDNKRVYDVMNALLHAGLIVRDPGTKVYRYRGVVGPSLIEFSEFGEKLAALRKERDEKVARVQELRATLASRRQ
jgi:hypothetical protein